MTTLASLLDPAKLRSPEPERARWQLLRAGILNLWEYDDQVFVFHRGRLLLRGRNESGKTKALELLFPFLLDADLRPERLDPFGDTSRRMAWNLLHDDDGEQLRIGYAWLELGRLDDGAARTLTLGAGLKAHRSDGQVSAWYFITPQRPGVELRLLDEQRAPLAKKALVAAVGDDGQVFESGRDFRRAVNDKLFGLPEQQYDALVATLLQLRRPQLSTKLKPDVLAGMLGASLPTLDAAVVGPLAEGFERLHRHKQERDQLEQVHRELASFFATYRKYASAVARRRAHALTTTESAFHRASERARELQARLAEAGDARARAEARRVDAELKEREADAKLRALLASDEVRAVTELAAAERDASEHERRAELDRRQAESEQQRLSAVERERAEQEAHAAMLERELDDSLAEAGLRARDAALAAEHASVATLLAGGDVATARAVMDAALEQRRRRASELVVESRRVESEEQRTAKAEERRQDAAERVRAAEGVLAEAKGAAARAERSYVDAVSTWSASVVAIELDDDARAALEGAAADELRRVAEEAAGECRRRTLDEAAALAARRQLVDDERAALVAEHDALASAVAPEPQAPHWRRERTGIAAGAPLYLVAEPHGGVDELRAARIEAALEAAGLLDAWVAPDGALLDADTFDVVLVPSATAGATLADVLRAVPSAGVDARVVEAVLRSVALVGANEPPPPEASSWVSDDGRFGVGVLRGAWQKPAAQFLGATARERERARRLAEMRAHIDERARVIAGLDERVAALRARAALIDEELARFPSSRELEQARARLTARSEELAARREELDETLRALVAAEAALAERRRARDALFARYGLTAWVGLVDDLARATAAYREQIVEALARGGRVTDARRERDRRRQEAEQAATAAAAWRRRAGESDERAVQALARVAALREMVGGDKETILAAIRGTEQAHADARAAARGAGDEERAAAIREAEEATRLESARDEVKGADEGRRAALEEFRVVGAIGLLEVIAVDGAEPPGSWSMRDALEVARSVHASFPDVEPSDDACARAMNLVVRRHQELTQSLPTEIRLEADASSGPLAYAAAYHARTHSLVTLLGAVKDDLVEREKLLADDERKLFESFLSGEAHEHLRQRLRVAHDLVEHINGELTRRPTPSGMVLRLVWEPATAGVPAGAERAIALWRRTGALLTDAQREQLLAFLRSRLELARAEGGHRSLQEALLAALDYRPWFEFHLEVKDPGGAWKKLTRKVHGAGSGGQKAMLLHLPLFAAAAAFYQSAAKTAPRIIALDEAFAGIDRRARAELMGFLAGFDLDFIMTSFDEWGCYAELDGLSTYNLSREPGLRGVYAEWFLWDGAQRIEAGAA